MTPKGEKVARAMRRIITARTEESHGGNQVGREEGGEPGVVVTSFRAKETSPSPPGAGYPGLSPEVSAAEDFRQPHVRSFIL